MKKRLTHSKTNFAHKAWFNTFVGHQALLTVLTSMPGSSSQMCNTTSALKWDKVWSTTAWKKAYHADFWVGVSRCHFLRGAGHILLCFQPLTLHGL